MASRRPEESSRGLGTNPSCLRAAVGSARENHRHVTRRKLERVARTGGDRGRDHDALVDGLPVLGHAAAARPGRLYAAGDDPQAAQGDGRGARGEPPELLPARLPGVPAHLRRRRRRRSGDRGRPEAPARVPRPGRPARRRLSGVRPEPEGGEPGGDGPVPQARRDPDQRLERPGPPVVSSRDGLLPGRAGGGAGEQPLRRRRRGTRRRGDGEPPPERLHRRWGGLGLGPAGHVRGRANRC